MKSLFSIHDIEEILPHNTESKNEPSYTTGWNVD